MPKIETPNPDPLIRLPKVRQLTGKPTSSIYADMANGRFPTNVRIGDRSVAWRLSDIQGWLDSRQPARVTPKSTPPTNPATRRRGRPPKAAAHQQAG